MVRFEAPVSTLTCFGKCCKWLLYVSNILFVFSAVAAVGVGVWTTVDETSNRIVALTNTSMYLNAAYVLIAAGMAGMFVSIVGCCGARYENRCLIVVYAVMLLLIFVAEFSSGVLALAYYTQIETFANLEMREAIVSKYGQSNHREATDAYNYMQNQFDCCGFEGDSHEAAQLYQVSLWFETSLILVPPSCCKRNENGEPINLLRCQSIHNNDLSFVNNVGCKEAVLDQGIMFATTLSGVGIALSMLQLLGAVWAFCLFRQL